MKKILCLILSFVLSFIVYATINSTVENIESFKIIENFIKDAKLVEEKSTSTIKFYEVKSDFELDSPTYYYSNGIYYPGGVGDILLTKKPAITIPLIYEGIKFYIGGHAAISGFSYEDQNKNIYVNEAIEVTGFGNYTLVRDESKSSWNNSYYDEIFAMRVNTSLDNRFKAFNRAISYFDEPYNYSFIFDVFNRKYCSDLVSQSYDYVDIHLNYDGIATTIYDLMVNKNVYMTYYSKVDDNKIRHIYALV